METQIGDKPKVAKAPVLGGVCFLRAVGPLALVLVQQLLAQADRARRHLDQLVVLDIGESLLQRHLDRRGQPHRLVLRRGADVGELLALEHVDDQVVVARVLADDHAVVNLPARLDHHRAAILEIPQRVGDGLALVVGDQHAIAAALDRALVRGIAVEQPVHDGGAARVGGGNTSRTRPPPEGRSSVISALRSAIFCTTTPECSSSTSIMTSSIGSSTSPASFLRNSTFGRDTDSSKPSRRMVSIRMPSCNSPRPATSMASLSSDSRTRSATLPSASRSRRSRIMRPVTLEPSVPASGESLTRKVIASVGGSIGCAGIDVSTAGSQMVMATVAFGRPASATMSPASASSTG